MDANLYRARMKDLKELLLKSKQKGDMQRVSRLDQRMVELKNVWLAVQQHVSHSMDEDSDEPADEQLSYVDSETDEMEGLFSQCSSEDPDNPAEFEPEDHGDEETHNQRSEEMEAPPAELEAQEDEENRDQRSKKKCPYCTATVVHLPRHLRDKHHWLPDKARKAVGRLGLRKQYKFYNQNVKQKSAATKHGKKKVRKSPSTSKDYHYERMCPITGCYSVTKRLDKHLLQVHKMQSDTKYKTLLLTAKRASTSLTTIPKPPLSRKCVRKPVVLDETQGNIEINTEPELPDFQGSEEDENDGEESHFDEAGVGPEEMAASIFDEFESWMVSADGGKKDEKTAKQHKRQLSKIVQVTGEGVESLLDYRLIRNKFVTQYCERDQKFRPQTIQSYLMSIRHFLSYLIADEPKQLQFDKNNVLSLRERFERWSGAYQKENNLRHWEKMEEDIQNILTPEAINTFERSLAARNAVVLLGQLSGGAHIEISQQNFTLIRDFLESQILINNAHRPGVIANFTIGEFRAVLKEHDSYTAHVHDHKTADVYGPATVVLTESLFGWLTVYFNKVRPHAAGVEHGQNERLFVSWNGKAMESGHVTKCIKSIFKKAGSSILPTATIVRKSAVTNARENARHLGSDLAELMLHQEKTADKYYKLKRKGKVAVQASKELGQLMRGVSTNEDKESSHSSNAQLPTECESLIERVSRVLEDQGKEQDTGTNNDVEDTVSHIVGPSESYRSSSTFQPDDSQLLSKLFEGMIQNVPIIQTVVARTLYEDEQGKELLKRFTPFQVVNRLKYLRRMRRQKKELELMKK